jgi:hypothetical protein
MHCSNEVVYTYLTIRFTGFDDIYNDASSLLMFLTAVHNCSITITANRYSASFLNL